MMKQTYSIVMNADMNAFSSLPRTTKFQLMSILAYMWSIVFAMGVGSIMTFGTSVIFHMLVLCGTFFTADLFQKARQGTISHRSAFKDTSGC